MGNELSHLWKTNKALVIVGGIGLLALLFIVYKSATKSGAGGSTSASGTDSTSAASTPTSGTSPYVTDTTHHHSGPAQVITGPAGPQGIQGVPGLPGVVGPQGPRGKPAPTPHPQPKPHPVPPPKKHHTDDPDHDPLRVHKTVGGTVPPTKTGH